MSKHEFNNFLRKMQNHVQIEHYDFTIAGDLITRYVRNDYNHNEIYEIPKNLLNYKITEEDYNNLIDILIEILNQYKENSDMVISASWALGKTNSERVIPLLFNVLKEYWFKDDDFAYQVLIALDNFNDILKIKKIKDLVRLISKVGKTKSKDRAKKMIDIENSI